jgi:hypothetical protein
MADVANAPFVMHGARTAIAGGMQHIEEQVTGIERAVVENPGLAFDLARSLIENVCRTVLNERTITFDPDDDLPKLFKTVTNALPFLPAPASGETKIRKSLTQTLGGLRIAIQGVCELRNQCGFASHGAGTARPAMESVQAFLAAEAADTIVGFLYRIHRQGRTPSEHPKHTYYDNPDFNDYVDDAHGLIRIFETEFKPSEVLFQMEPETYRVYLAEFEPEATEEEHGAGEEDTAETSP